MSSYSKGRDEIINRLRRIEGQVRGLQRMINEEKYCIDILTQISSVLAATEKVALILLDDHIRGCVQNSLKHGHGEETVDELVETISRYVKR